MDLFSVDFSLNELNFLRQSLDLVTVKGTDAKFLAGLQLKIENELAQIQEMIAKEQSIKENSLKEIIGGDITKLSPKK